MRILHNDLPLITNSMHVHTMKKTMNIEGSVSTLGRLVLVDVRLDRGRSTQLDVVWPAELRRRCPTYVMATALAGVLSCNENTGLVARYGYRASKTRLVGDAMTDARRGERLR